MSNTIFNQNFSIICVIKIQISYLNNIIYVYIMCIYCNILYTATEIIKILFQRIASVFLNLLLIG